MAMHCPNCNYSSESEFDDTCPICFKPLLTQKEFDRDWGAYVGNPGPWHGRLQSVRKIYYALFIAFSLVAIICLASRFLIGRP